MEEEVEEQSCKQIARKIEGEIKEAFGAQRRRELPKGRKGKGSNSTEKAAARRKEKSSVDVVKPRLLLTWTRTLLLEGKWELGHRMGATLQEAVKGSGEQGDRYSKEYDLREFKKLLQWEIAALYEDLYYMQKESANKQRKVHDDGRDGSIVGARCLLRLNFRWKR